jgi:TonB-dependent SusC/RagA subfamily outer membrane receptor
LYIIDGVVESKRAVDALDTKTIQSVNVLKGQSATTLYGEKGKNGVVIITTKNATNVKTKAVQVL